MKPYPYWIALFLICIFLLSSCFPSRIQGFEPARTVGKGNLELSGNFQTDPSPSWTKIYTSAGVRGSFGVSDNFDVRLRADWLDTRAASGLMLKVSTKINYIPKPKKKHPKTEMSFSPYLFYAKAFRHSIIRTFEDVASSAYGMGLNINFGIRFNDKFDLVFNEDFGFVYVPYDIKVNTTKNATGFPILGTGLNFGISSNLNKWAIRPGVSVTMVDAALFEGTGYQLNIGMGFNYYLNLKGKKMDAN